MSPACPVRGCGLGLSREAGRFACPSGHSFDVAREGHLTLLQPQDRRSAEPGDAPETVDARDRALAAGAGDVLAACVTALVLRHAPAGCEQARPIDGLGVLDGCVGAVDVLDVLDVGCGEGFMLRRLAAARPIMACGIDLSSRAAARAARRMPEALVVVANADRGLPWPDGSFHVVLSITARRPVAEMRRVLRLGGLVVVAVPAPEDLVELREAVLGEARPISRVEDLRREFAAGFVEREHAVARARLRLSADIQRDLLASTYRGARASRQEALQRLAEGEVTLAQDVLAFTREAP